MLMKRLLVLAILLFAYCLPALLAVSLPLVSLDARAQQLDTLDAATVPAAPKTRTDQVKDVVQGVEITDSYRWLEDQNSAETRSWIDAQNAYTDSQLTRLPGRTELKQLLSGLIDTDDTYTPTVENHRYFFLKHKAGQDQSVLYLRNGLDGKEEALVDPMALSADHSITVGISAVSRDGSLLVYSLREGGADERTPHLFDVEARKDLPDHFPNAIYDDIALMPDKSGLYYTRHTAEGPRVFFHKIGVDPAGDMEVFGKGYGLDKGIGLDVSDDGRYLAFQVAHGTSGSTEIYFQDLRKKGPITPIVNDLDAKFYEEILGDRMFLRTNWKAPKWRIVEVDLRNPARNRWRETLPEGEAVLDNFSVVGGKLAVRFLQNVVWQVKIFEPSGKFVREIRPPALGTVSGLSGDRESNEGFFTFTSYHIPQTIYRYDMASGKQEVWSQRKVPFDSSKYDVEQVWYNSKDGTRVPMLLAHAKGLTLNGSNPVLLSGYGGFNLSYPPAYNSYVAAWLASGGVYAFAHIRGGGEFGEEWHHAGMFEKKQNVFDDFIAAAEWLIQNKYTKPSRLAIAGGSNGGLLVGAALTQRPDLFAAVVCNYPLLDMVRYHKFLRAKLWVSEYGSSEDPEQFKYIYAYSPYHHVLPGTKYPAVLLNTGDGDTRVAPLHARKMTALLQAATASGRPILLHYETKSGHSGGTPISKVIDDDANELSFLFWQLGVHPGSAPASVAKAGP
ncbi:MAG TPA: prolyl oligopeptidase family serine peptidase [Terriglobales bacterium]|nr:prolyl oligopeptidase family serine peptidase [Terriglobales bacterium]